jgi:hypothetical protein
MGKVVQTNGDYTIKTTDGGTILLDTGEDIGFVIVTGNLIVDGDNLTISTNNLNVTDNIITLNFYDGPAESIPAGVVNRYSGIQIDRGSLDDVTLLWDDINGFWFFANGSAPGPFTFADSKLKLKEILTNQATDRGDLILIGSSSPDGVIKVTGTTNYTEEIISRINNSDPEVNDIIANKGYVDYAIDQKLSSLVTTDDTRVTVTDKDVEGSLEEFEELTGNNYTTFGESAVSVLIDGVLNTQFFETRTEVLGIEINNDYEITTVDGITNQNIKIRTQGTGKLETNYGIQLETIAGTPSYVPNAVVLYSNTPAAGNTGLFYVNQNDSDELISKRKALVFSLIF